MSEVDSDHRDADHRRPVESPEAVGADQIPQASIDVGKLLAGCRDKTQCYKLLLLRALVDDLVETGRSLVPYVDLSARMVAMAWWPARRYRLTLGLNDKLGIAVWKVGTSPVRVSPERFRIGLKAELGDQTRSGILEYAPQRLLVPWFSELNEKVGRRVDAHIREAGRAVRDKLGLPYCHDQTRAGLDVAPEWKAYFVENASFIRGWVDLEWLGWLQARNPNALVSRNKLFPPPKRGALKPKAELFRAVLRETALNEKSWCSIYGDDELFTKAIHVDHFLPWSFIAHDAIWNLAPVNASTNGAKGDKLPAARFVTDLASFHTRVIAHLQAHNLPQGYLDEYELGLRVDRALLSDPQVVMTAFHDVLQPLLRTAALLGFDPDWEPRR